MLIKKIIKEKGKKKKKKRGFSFHNRLKAWPQHCRSFERAVGHTQPRGQPYLCFKSLCLPFRNFLTEGCTCIYPSLNEAAPTSTCSMSLSWSCEGSVPHYSGFPGQGSRSWWVQEQGEGGRGRGFSVGKLGKEITFEM